jgi:YHS domain-containing protein
MLRKIAGCFMALTCAAAFTFVSAQLPWETGYSSSESSSSGESPYSSSSDDSPYGSGSSSDESSSENALSSESSSNETAQSAKPKKEKKERVVPAGFSTQKSCPVCNSTKIKKNLFVSYNGQRIHVCSAACIGRVKRNPAKFIEILEKRGEGPER